MPHSWEEVMASPYIRYHLVGIDKPPSFPVDELPEKSLSLIPHDEWDDFWRQICALARQRSWIDRYSDCYIKVRNAACLILVFSKSILFLMSYKSSDVHKISDIIPYSMALSLGYSLAALWLVVTLYTLESRVRVYQLHTIRSVCRKFQDLWADRYGTSIHMECEYEPSRPAVRPLSKSFLKSMNGRFSQLSWVHLPWSGGIYLYLYPTRQQYARIVRWPVYQGFVHGMFQPKLQVDASTKAALVELDQSSPTSIWDNWLDMTRKLQEGVNGMAWYSRSTALAFLCVVVCAPKADTVVLLATLFVQCPFGNLASWSLEIFSNGITWRSLASATLYMVMLLPILAYILKTVAPSNTLLQGITILGLRQLMVCQVHETMWPEPVASRVQLFESITHDHDYKLMLRMEYQQVYRFDWLVGLSIGHVAVLVLPPPRQRTLKCVDEFVPSNKSLSNKENAYS